MRMCNTVGCICQKEISSDEIYLILIMFLVCKRVVAIIS